MPCRPAARKTDNHTCPSTDPKPHVGGPISAGSQDVEVNKLATARKGDAAVCLPTLDLIKKGALTVLVNNRQFARQDDPTIHGGQITIGSTDVIVGSVPAECEFLDHPYTVEAPKKNFDAIRDSSTTGSKQSGTHTFPGDTNSSAADIYDVTVNGQTIKVIAPTASTATGKHLPSVDQVAKALGVVPPGQLASIKQVVLSPNQNPDDAYWAQEYNTPNFTSLATGGNGGVTFYPWSSPLTQETVDSTMIHEGGHTFSQGLWSDPAIQTAWESAITADDLAPSDYAENASTEDFSESLVMYSLAKGTPCEAIARATYPHRFAILDKLLAKP